MGGVRTSVVIDAPPKAVWAVLEDLDSHVDWMADAAAITFTSDRRRGVGTRFDCETRIGPLRTLDRMTVTEWSPGRAMGVRHEGIVGGTGRFTLRRARGGRTTVTWKEALRFPRWAGGPVGAFVARPVLRRVWAGNLRRLKAKVEGR